ncbi:MULTISPECIES: energy transducer TonB [unclassified Sulfitobacter]|uniref:energy transducer TonB n=1 Tax=unclassified Sulfitobacter TaxID=196795 RepID=UPI001594D8DD|nr:energy transducer TonB [Sulfitobacter sp. HGT1]
MKQFFEFSAFLAGATALHLTVGYIAPTGTQSAAGAGGDATVTLAAANMSVQDMVTEWEKPVEVVQNVVQPAQLLPELAAPEPAMPQSAVTSRAPSPMPAAGAAPALPDVDQTPAAKPKLPEQRPKLRPEKVAKPKPTPKPVAKAKSVQTPKATAQKPQPKKSSQSNAPQKAAGSGGKTAKGSAGTGAATKAKPANRKNLMASWGGQIRTSIERRKRYPSGTRAHGTVTLAISVHTKGQVTGVSVRKSSGVAQIDRAAVAAVKSARIASAPKGLKSGVHSFTLPMKFAP